MKLRKKRRAVRGLREEERGTLGPGPAEDPVGLLSGLLTARGHIVKDTQNTNFICMDTGTITKKLNEEVKTDKYHCVQNMLRYLTEIRLQLSSDMPVIIAKCKMAEQRKYRACWIRKCSWGGAYETINIYVYPL